MIQELKEQVELKFGKKITYQKDCKTLSDSILNESGLYISPSTLRRFFGFLKTNSNPSRVSLDTLSQYCGFANWDDFFANNSDSRPSGEKLIDLWEKIRKKSETISKKSCEVIKRQIPIDFSNTVIRSFAEERLSYFMKSKYIATPFVGPGGYGKSTLLVGWYSKYSSLPQNRKDIILFISASTLESVINAGPYFENWLLSILNIDAGSDFFDQVANPCAILPGKFILIIDALDELIDVGSKSEKIFNGIHKFINQISSQKQCIKLIISSRQATWQYFYKEETSKDQWYYAGKENFTSADANMPPFSDYEIQAILDNTINKGSTARVVVEELTPDLLQIISYPYYIQLFIKIFNPYTSHLIGDRLDLLNEFINKELYKSQFSDEKFDILNKIIDLSLTNKTPGIAIKNVLKELYPIHLKLSGNYYHAYNQLLSYGLLSEELVENRFGAYTKQIRISQWAIYELLLVQKLIQQNKEINFFLFKKIELDFAQSPILPNLICMLFEIAYKNKNLEALEKFFSLSDETLSLALSQPTIPLALRRDDYMRNALIPFYAKDPRARKYLFEDVVNINTIATSWKFMIFNYLQRVTSEKDKFYAKTLLCISDLLRLDLNWVNRFNDEFPNQTPHNEVSPYVKGLWFSCKLICLYFSDSNRIEEALAQAEQYSKHQESTWNENDLNNFDYGLVIGLLVAKQYDRIHKLLKRFAKPKPKENLIALEKALILTYEYSKWLNESTFDAEKMQDYEGFLNEMPQWNSYIPIIIGKNWLAMYYLSLGKAEKAYELFRKSIEISNMAGYLVFEGRVLKQLYSVLLSLGEKKKAYECESFAKGLVEKKGNIFDLL